jgi:hypothetical protein
VAATYRVWGFCIIREVVWVETYVTGRVRMNLQHPVGGLSDEEDVLVTNMNVLVDGQET